MSQGYLTASDAFIAIDRIAGCNGTEEVGEFETQENRPFGRLSMDTSFCPTEDDRIWTTTARCGCLI